MKTSRMRAPSTTLRLPRRRRSQRGRVDGATAGAAGTRTSTVASVIADAGVDEGVEDVHARDVEDDLRDDGAADQHGGGDTDHGDHGDERVAERVHPGHRALG